jgi:hypothetical protein
MLPWIIGGAIVVAATVLASDDDDDDRDYDDDEYDYESENRRRLEEERRRARLREARDNMCRTVCAFKEKWDVVRDRAIDFDDPPHDISEEFSRLYKGCLPPEVLRLDHEITEARAEIERMQDLLAKLRTYNHK